MTDIRGDVERGRNGDIVLNPMLDISEASELGQYGAVSAWDRGVRRDCGASLRDMLFQTRKSKSRNWMSHHDLGPGSDVARDHKSSFRPETV